MKKHKCKCFNQIIYKEISYRQFTAIDCKCSCHSEPSHAKLAA